GRVGGEGAISQAERIEAISGWLRHPEFRPGLSCGRSSRWSTGTRRGSPVSNPGRFRAAQRERVEEPAGGAGLAAPRGLIAFPASAGMCPSLVVWGTDSDVLSEAQARRIVETLPKGELVTVPGIGHAPALVEPAVVAALERFL